MHVSVDGENRQSFVSDMGEFQLVADVVNLLLALMELRVLSINTSGHFAFAVIVTKHESLIRIDSVNSTVLEFNVRCCGASKNQRSEHWLLRFRVTVLSIFFFLRISV